MHALDLKVPPVALALITAAGMVALAWALPAAALPLPASGARVAAAALAAAGVAVALAGVLAFRRMRTTVNPMAPERATALVAVGIFRASRNPMYVGMLLVLAGWAVFLGNAAAALLVPAFVAWMTRFQILPEERALAERFGASYLDYCARVRRWL
jgi:protein-S-isoprenylcysteine O-methyltransferase Ste14